MDHTAAHLIEYSTEDYKVETIHANGKSLDNQEGVQHSEITLHHKENQNIKTYYKKIIDAIKDHDEIVLFGPTSAKTELYNLIREDHKYDHLKIETKSAGKMSYTEQHAFIVDYFKKLLNYENTYNK